MYFMLYLKLVGIQYRNPNQHFAWSNVYAETNTVYQNKLYMNTDNLILIFSPSRGGFFICE